MISVKKGLTTFKGPIDELINDYATLNIAVRQTLRRKGIPEAGINKIMTDVLFYSANYKGEGEVIRDETKIIAREKNEEERPCRNHTRKEERPMVCPYRKEVIHVDRMADGYIISPAQDVERFAKCQGRECPFYTEQIKGEPHCMRAGRERSGRE